MRARSARITNCGNFLILDIYISRRDLALMIFHDKTAAL